MRHRHPYHFHHHRRVHLILIFFHAIVNAIDHGIVFHNNYLPYPHPHHHSLSFTAPLNHGYNASESAVGEVATVGVAFAVVLIFLHLSNFTMTLKILESWEMHRGQQQGADLALIRATMAIITAMVKIISEEIEAAATVRHLQRSRQPTMMLMILVPMTMQS